MRKRKRVRVPVPVPRKRLRGLLWAAFAAAFLTAVFVHDVAAGSEDRRMGTRSGQAEITRDPATGDLNIATPAPAPQDQDHGPRTVIVAPEVFLDNSPSRPSARPSGTRAGTRAGTGTGTDQGVRPPLRKDGR